MFGYEESQYLEELADEYNEALEAGRYHTRATGPRAEHTDGVVRDKQQGKIKYTLMFPEGVPKKDQLIVRLAELYTRGGGRYGDRNWEGSRAPDTLAHHTEALWRHFMNFFFDVQDGEDHAAAIIWNINAVELTRRHIAEDLQDEKEALANLYKGQKEYIFPLPDPSKPGEYEDHKVEAPTLTDAMEKFEHSCVKGICGHRDVRSDLWH